MSKTNQNPDVIEIVEAKPDCAPLGLLDALVEKWTERRTNLLQCSKLAAGRGAYTEASTMQIRADTTLQCLEELHELRQASNACVSDGPADAHKPTSSAEGPFAARNG